MSAFSEVENLIDEYFAALYHADVRRLAGVLHRDALYATVSGGDLLRLDMPSYFAVVAQRQPAAARKEPRVDRIVTIDFAGPKTALVKYHCTLAGKAYVDFLSLVHDEGRWQIISKVFHYDPVPPDAVSS